MNYLFTNIIGTFILDDHFKIIDQITFKTVQDYLTKETSEQKLTKKHPLTKPLPPEKLALALNNFRNKKYHLEFYQKNLSLTKKAIRNSVTEDQLIIQAIANINELDKTINLLGKRLREWYSLHFPELSEKIDNHEKYAQFLLEKTRTELIKELNIDSEIMGADLDKTHLDEIKQLANQILQLRDLRYKHESYLHEVMQKYCPNILEMSGTTIGAKLIELARGLKQLAILPASTVQLLGAEKALFRHIKTGSRSPKYGVIINHPFIQNAPRDCKGKASRILADKITLCARLDYFHGEFKALEYKQDLEEKLSQTKKKQPKNVQKN
ncbi:hypothetical protein HYX11_03640 [Candidatus Woesearchaeota archaeon]|nr:hypothetical protein [Candidatus Woesearchaeota archaeon]